MVTSSVSLVRGAPTLFVNGRPVAGAAYITYYTHRNRYADFAALGCKLYSVTVYFGEKTINEVSQIPPFKKGMFDAETPDFSIPDADVRAILAACPDAMIFPRVNMALPTRWEAANPDELCDTGTTEQHRPCFSSRAWMEETKRELGLYIDHVEASDYADHIVGYQIADGNTEEWFSFDQKGSVGRRARERYAEWLRDTGEEESEASWYAYLSWVTADDICDLAAFVKAKTDRRLVVGTFYGYTMECPGRASCHHSMRTVLASPDVDFVCSPVSYAFLRAPKRDLCLPVAIDSVRLHGKLYMAENDVRTHLSQAPNSLPHYNKPVWFGPEKPVSMEVMKMAASRGLTHGYAGWWFDMWGGWYADADYLRLLKRHFELAGATERDRRSRAETAVFVDERSYAGIADGSGRFVYEFREPLGKIGAPYDVYLADDFAAVRRQYRAVILLVPAPTKLSREIAAVCAREGRPLLTVAPGRMPDTAELRGFCASAGVTLYTDRPAVVGASGDYLFLHTVEDGEITLRDGERTAFTDLFTGETYAFPCVLPAGKSLLFGR